MKIDPKSQSFQDNHKLMIGSIVPRPIAFVSTKSTNNILNLAPFSYFNGVCSNPPTIMFAPARRGYDGLTKDTLNLSVNNTTSGDGKETLTVKFDHDLEISFNSRYLIDVASQLDGDKIEIFFNDIGSPALIKDPGDFDSIFVVMPMKG